MPINIRIPGHIILPYGSPKWDIDNIRLSGVSTDGTYFSSETKCAYIDAASERALRLGDFRTILPDAASTFPKIENAEIALNYIRDSLKDNCALQTKYERSFLDLYFSHVIDEMIWTSYEGDRSWRCDQRWAFWALMPLPQAHIYARDPFTSYHDRTFHPERMFKVDFAFWTGKRFVAVEIDGESHIGNKNHVTKDRMLSRAGVTVIHILNSEIRAHGERVITSLLPEPITDPWGQYPSLLKGTPPDGVSNPFFTYDDEILF